MALFSKIVCLHEVSNITKIKEYDKSKAKQTSQVEGVFEWGLVGGLLMFKVPKFQELFFLH